MGNGLKTGTCGLCKKSAILKKSHLIPKSAYRGLRRSGKGHLSPTKVEIDRKRFGKTDKQIVEYFLCFKCEQTFSRRGEDAVSKIWARGDKFPFLEKLCSLKPIESEAESTGYATEDLDIPLVMSLHYFAISMVWRAIRWPGKDCGFGASDTGVSDEVMGQVEEYLLEGTSGLQDTLILLSVNTYSGLNDLISVPSCHTGALVHYFEFYILGMRFRVFLNFRYSEFPGLKQRNDGLNFMIVATDHGREPFIKEAAAFFVEHDIF